MRTPLALCLVAAGLSGAGCGGGDNSKPTATNTPPATIQSTGNTAPAPTPTTTTAAEPRPDYKAAASRSLLRLSDFPTGWTKKSDDDDSKIGCEEVTAARNAAAGRAVTGNFDDSNSQVSEAVYVYASEAEARANYENLTTETALECLSNSVRDVIDEADGVKVRSVERSELNITPVGSDSSAIRLQLDIGSTDGDATAFIDIINVRASAGLAFTTAISFSTPFDDTLRGQLIGAGARRLDSELEELE